MIVSTIYVRLADSLLSPDLSTRRAAPFAVLSPFLLIALYLPSSLSSPASPIFAFAAESLCQAEQWTPPTYHLPSAEEFLRSCWQVLSKATSSLEPRLKLVQAALLGRSIEVKREALLQLLALAEDHPDVVNSIRDTLQSCLLDPREAGDVRVAVAEILRFASAPPAEKKAFDAIKALSMGTTDVPLREALMPVLAGMATEPIERDAVLELIERWSRPIEVSLLRDLRLPFP